MLNEAQLIVKRIRMAKSLAHTNEKTISTMPMQSNETMKEHLRVLYEKKKPPTC